MVTKPKFELQADAAKNLATLHYFGHVTAADTQAAAAKIERVLPQLRSGFTVLTDLSELESMDLDCVPSLTKIMGKPDGVRPKHAILAFSALIRPFRNRTLGNTSLKLSISRCPNKK